jgi:hypothetical protein
LAKFGATRTVVRLDLGFGDCVEPVEYPVELTSTPRGPLFESKISLQCYPKEFIFAEKLETVIFRGERNTRMKDFHDLFSLTMLGDLDSSRLMKAIHLVFFHRKTPLETLPIILGKQALTELEKNWRAYRIKVKDPSLPKNLRDVVFSLNNWLEGNLII